jgi:vacuolar iron transporter family protein
MFTFKDVSFGATSAVMTSLAIVIGLSEALNTKMTIVTALLIIAIADNISDSFGIHMHEEAENKKHSEVNKTTMNNFLTRALITFIFIIIVLLFAVPAAIIISMIFGVLIIVVLSYYVAKQQGDKVNDAIIKHVLIAFLVMIASFLLRNFIQSLI